MTAGEGREVPSNSTRIYYANQVTRVDRNQWSERLRGLKPQSPIYGEKRELKMELVTSTDNNLQQTLHWTPDDIIHHISIANSP